MAGVTLRQIADKIGCSRSTVSYALKNNPNISREMRDRVRKVAEELGWMPDADLAKQMALVRSTMVKQDLPNLALVVHKSAAQLAVEDAPRNQLLGAEAYARRMGYHVNLFNLVDKPLSPKRLRDILVARGVQGIVYIASISPGMPMDYLEIGLDFSCSVVGVRYPDMPFHVAISDFLGDCRMAYLKILEMGLKRPGVVLPLGLDKALSFAYTGGLASGMMSLEEKNRLPICYAGSTENRIPAEDYGRVKDWIRTNQPDCLVSTDSWQSRDILNQMEAPWRDLPLFSLDWFPKLPVEGGVYCMQDQVGMAGVDIVVAQLHRGESGLPDYPRTITIEGIWVSKENREELDRRVAEALGSGAKISWEDRSHL